MRSLSLWRRCATPVKRNVWIQVRDSYADDALALLAGDVAARGADG